MSDTIQTLNEIVSLCGQRQAAGDGANEEQFTANFGLLEKVVGRAGDCLEEHIQANKRRKPRKERVYKQIVEEIAVHFCDICDNAKQAQNIEVDVREILAAYDITTVDYTGREVKIV